MDLALDSCSTSKCARTRILAQTGMLCERSAPSVEFQLMGNRQNLRSVLTALASAARRGLEGMSLQEACADGFEGFPSGTCGAVSELMGRIVLERTGRHGTYVCGTAHPTLKPQHSHAWLEVDGFIVDLTHDQFSTTNLVGWVFETSAWHSGFERETQALCLSPVQWAAYPLHAYAAMARACDEVKAEK